MAKKMWVTEFGKTFNTQREALDSEEEDHIKSELIRIINDEINKQDLKVDRLADALLHSPVLFIKYVVSMEAYND